MLSIRSSSILLLSAGLALLAFELHRALTQAGAAMALYGLVWLVRERLLRKPHHAHSFHRTRREMLTTAVISALFVVLAALVLTAADLGSDGAPYAAQAGADDQLPWTAAFLVNGIGTVVALAWVLVGARGLQRRAKRHHHTAAPVSR